MSGILPSEYISTETTITTNTKNSDKISIEDFTNFFLIMTFIIISAFCCASCFFQISKKKI